ncbi:histidine phosphatase family protein [Kibdelosporangium philippinense]|uniref:Histidine phosphatase family protein n=1 Tax=Kibdelosporangium philippinense TaxID=211113 RepID=A0ABS8ZHY2_9PSEU|nr:histidine phosphatase family protein [Kibdelosporangium philippinense]MCE7007157.1 histidine phosphatase family protein [Kibdelosporangium philippinense]
MPLVYLIRHGQASFGADDYDVLSPVGHRQGKHVGAELRRRGVRADQVWSGSLKRQRDTALAAELDADPRQDSRWDEFDHIGLVREIHGDVVTPRSFQESLDVALRQWDGLRGFTETVASALADLRKSLESGQTAVVFTSGGVIAAVCASLWGLDANGFVAVNRVSVNCGITKLVVGRSGTSLVTYNDHAHFEGEHRDLLTYR